MLKWLSTSFWDYIASKILRNRVFLLILILLFTIFMSFQWKNMRFTFTEANLLPDDHEVNIQYNSFLEKFGEEGNLVVLGFKDKNFFTEKNYKAWEKFVSEIKKDKANNNHSAIDKNCFLDDPFKSVFFICFFISVQIYKNISANKTDFSIFD